MDDESPSTSSDELDNKASAAIIDVDEVQKNYLVPRDYQLEIFETARTKNTIIVLGTGSGKTFISILLIKDNGHQIRGKLSEGAKRSFFIVNSVPLVYQQQKAIKGQTAFKVGAYEGSMGVDFWSHERWKKELENHEVIVIVAQIFLNIILHKLITFSDINLIIMDECHHAQGNHPMREIMREYSTSKVYCPHVLPRMCGMTASVINCKVPHIKVPEKMKNLETVMDSSLLTTHYHSSVSKYCTNSQESIIIFDETQHSAISTKIIDLINNMVKVGLANLKLLMIVGDKNIWKAEKFVSKLGLSLIDVLREIGEYSLCEAVNMEIESLEVAESDNPHMKKVYQMMSSHLTQLKNSLECITSSFSGIRKHVTTKVLRLLEILERGRHQTYFSVLIFVQRRNTAKLLHVILDKLAQEKGTYSYFKVGVVVGGLNSMQREDIRLKEQIKQEKVLKCFRQGLLNIVVSTSVLEEGIDIRKCNIVIRFNIPQNFRSYIQSLGRARASPSYYIMLCGEDIHEDLVKDIRCYKEIHRLLTYSCFNRQLPTVENILEEFSSDCDIPPFQPFGALGPKITALSAIPLLNVYCGRLPKDKFTNLTVDDQQKKENDSFYVGLSLPINAPFRQTIWSEPMTSFDLAKKDAALKLCRTLYTIGKLDLNLLPIRTALHARDKDHLGILDQLDAAKREIGTRKNRQTHERKICAAFKQKDNMFLHTVEFKQIKRLRADINFGEDVNIGFICSEILLPTKFHLQHAKWGKLEIMPRFVKQIRTDVDVKEIRNFHRVIMTLLLNLNGKAFVFDPSTAKQNIFIVPLKKDSEIDFCTMSKVNDSLFLKTEDKTRLIASHEKLLDSIVRPKFGNDSSTLFFVKQIRLDYSPQYECKFTHHEQSNNATYIDYYKSKYDYEVLDVTQPMINCSHVPNNLNCIGECKYNKVKNNILLLIPEICDILSIPAALFWKITCIPSILHRINGLQLEKELLDEMGFNINYNSLIPLCYDWVNEIIDTVLSSRSKNICVNLVHKKNCVIPSGAILQALTPIATMDQFNLERLEVLGDSYLKFRSSKYLYLKEDMENEGILTQCRCNIVSNKTLFLLAKKKNIGDYIQGTILMSPTFPLPYGFLIKPEIESLLLSDSVNPVEWHKFGQKILNQNCIESYNPYSQHLLADKCIADTVEAQIGAMLLCGGEEYATRIMKWFGFKFLNENISVSSIRDGVTNKETEAEFKNMYAKNCLDLLENSIGYSFKNKRLLLEACTHPSYSYNKITGCYQRLEFIGDAVLDYLITGHIYTQYRDADPGKLTDWRSFYVNNETLAEIAVANRFYIYLLHLSPALEKVIDAYINLPEDKEAGLNIEGDNVEVEDIEVPKALGDLIESIIGAVYVDSECCLSTTWQLVMFLYKDIFDKVKSPPINCVRQLYEKDPSVKFKVKVEDDRSLVIANVKGLDPITGMGKNRRVAKQAAAKYALQLLAEKNSVA